MNSALPRLRGHLKLLGPAAYKTEKGLFLIFETFDPLFTYFYYSGISHFTLHQTPQLGQICTKALFIVAMALISSAAFAAPSFKIYEVAVPNSKRAAVLEATDTFMKSAKGKTYNGGLRVNTILANGISPATHTFILLMDSMAAIEEWETSLIGEPDITTFGAALEENSTPSSKYMSRMMETWGNISNDNRTWLITRFRTTDPMAVVKD